MERGHGPAIYRRECPEDVPLIPPDSSGNCIQATMDPPVQFPTPLAEDQAGQLPLHATEVPTLDPKYVAATAIRKRTLLGNLSSPQSAREHYEKH